MSLTGARGLARVSQNLRCDLQTAMVARRVHEIKFYEAFTGERFAGEYGERQSARRRGRAFEQHLYRDRAAELRRALAPRFGYDAERMRVRNFKDEVPERMPDVHELRHLRTARALADIAAGAEPPSVPHLLIEPQLRLPIGDDQFIYVAPDFAAYDPGARIYVVGEIKSFIVRAGVADRADLERARRQAAVEVLALRDAAEQVGLAERVGSRALFVFATPRGVEPHTPVEESLRGEVAAVRRALASYRRATAGAPLAYRAGSEAEFVARARELPINLQDSCLASCALYDYCQRRSADAALVLGDAAGDLFGRDTKLERLYALARDPALAASPAESELADLLHGTLADLKRDRLPDVKKVA